jgi:putative membrane protein
MRTPYLLAAALIGFGAAPVLAAPPPATVHNLLPKTPPLLPQPDRDFASFARRANDSEIEAAQWPAKGTAPEPVRRLTEEIIRDHEDARRALAATARQQNFTLPALPTTREDDFTSKLQGMREPQQSRAYAQHEIQTHEREIKMYQHELDDSKNDGLRAYAGEYLPKLQRELTAARKIASGQQKG